jgi:glycosyltransferase involved in cell wall biosynthesis
VNIALISPEAHVLQHRVRGSGFYIENLKENLPRFDKKNTYFFTKSGRDLQKQIDLVHFVFFEPFFRNLPIMKKKKTIVTIHDLIPLKFPKQFPRGIRGNLRWQLQKISLKNCNAIITDSHSSKKDILGFVGLKNEEVKVIHLAAGKQFKKIKQSDANKIRNKFNLPERFALYVGDVTWNKNLPRLVEAVKKANVPLVLVGKALVETNFDRKNPWNQDLEKVQRGIGGDSLFLRLGFVNDNDLVLLYNLATLFVMPSLYEGFGLPILEAMKCGCPVVTSKEGSIPEIAGDAAFYVDAYDTDSIAEGITKVFSDSKLQNELSRKGLAQVSKFSWEKTAKETIRIYESV